METISSRDNPKYVYFGKLTQKKYRKDSGLFLLEGIRLCRDAIAQGVHMEYTIVDAGKADAVECARDFDNVVYFTSQLFDSFTDTIASQGIVCIGRQTAMDFALPQCNSLILDRVQDPGNLGTIFRSAAANNFLDIYLLDCVDPFNEKVLRSSMGAIFRLRLHKTNVESIAQYKMSMASTFLVADMNGEDISKIQLPKGHVAVIIGNEGSGVSDELKALADVVLSIPMDNAVESLNAGVSASIIMYEIRRGR